MTDTLDGRAIGRTLWLPPSGSITITLDVSTSDDPDISGRDVELWFQPLSLGAPDSGESLVTVTRDYTDAATGVATYTFEAGALWTAVGSSTVRGLVVPASGEPWFSLLVVLDLDGTQAQTATTLPAIVGGALELSATLSTVAGSPGPAGADGNTILYGSGAPDDGADGVDGDFYIDTDGPTLYGPKAGGSWPSGVSMVGPSGSGTGDMLAANNLSDVADVPTARTNLGLGTAAAADMIDEDDMTSDSDTDVPTQQSVKAYVDANAGGGVDLSVGPSFVPATATYIGPAFNGFGASTLSSTVTNSCSVTSIAPVQITRDTEIESLTIRVTIAATDPGAVFEVGVCPVTTDGTHVPDYASMLATVEADATSATKQTMALPSNQTLTAGLWYFCVGLKSATSKVGTNPQLRTIRTYGQVVGPHRFEMDNVGQKLIGARAVDADISTSGHDYGLVLSYSESASVLAKVSAYP